MPSPSSTTPSRMLHVSFLAGVATAPTFMKEFAEKLSQIYEAKGFHVMTQLLFPYGDWYTSLYRQLHEIRKDMLPFVRSVKPAWLGGRRSVSGILEAYQGGAIWLVGHSGGGVAGVHAGDLLLREHGLPVERIIQIGSPRCAIPPSLEASSTMYMYAVNGKGRRTDPITRIGTWGGWERSRSGVPVWNPYKYAPDRIVPLRLQGGHPDYFRSADPYVDAEGRSNLEHILRTVQEQDLVTESKRHIEK
jgi:hypothetical protein